MSEIDEMVYCNLLGHKELYGLDCFFWPLLVYLVAFCDVSSDTDDADRFTFLVWDGGEGDV